MSLEKQNEIMWNAMGRLMKMKALPPAASRIIIDATSEVMRIRKEGLNGFNKGLFREATLPLTVDGFCKVENIDTHIFQITKIDKIETDGKITELFDIQSYWNLKTNSYDDTQTFHNVTKPLLKSVIKQS